MIRHLFYKNNYDMMWKAFWSWGPAGRKETCLGNCLNITESGNESGKVYMDLKAYLEKEIDKIWYL